LLLAAITVVPLFVSVSVTTKLLAAAT